MTDSSEKRAAEIQDAIGRVLYHEWDPIGVSGSAPEDEYDRSIAPVSRILAGSRSEPELIDFCFTERDFIGMPCKSPEQLRPVARRLLELEVRL
jgi:hypothetical protein